MMSFPYDNLQLDLLIDLVNLHNSETCRVAVPSSFETSIDDQIFEVSAFGGELLLCIDVFHTLELYRIGIQLPKDYRANLIRRDDVAKQMLACLFRVGEAVWAVSEERFAKAIYQTCRSIDEWKTLLAMRDVPDWRLDFSCMTASTIGHWVHPAARAREYVAMLDRFERRLKKLHLAFRIAPSRQGSEIRICFVPPEEAEVLRRIARECQRCIGNSDQSTRQWLLSLWERTRRLESPSPDWLESWHSLIRSAVSATRMERNDSNVITDSRRDGRTERLLSHLHAYKAEPSHRFF